VSSTESDGPKATQELADAITIALLSHYHGAHLVHAQVVKRVANGRVERVSQVFLDLPSGDRIVCYAYILPAEQRGPAG
jgi:hypothetical protein